MRIIKLFLVCLFLSTISYAASLDFDITGHKDNNIDSSRYLFTLETKYAALESGIEIINNNSYYRLLFTTCESNLGDETLKDILLSGWSADVNIRESSNINQANIYYSVLKIYLLKLRITNTWNKWKYKDCLYGIVLDIFKEESGCMLSYDSNFKNINRLTIRVRGKGMFNKFYIKPWYEYYKSNVSEYMDWGINLGIEF